MKSSSLIINLFNPVNDDLIDSIIINLVNHPVNHHQSYNHITVFNSIKSKFAGHRFAVSEEGDSDDAVPAWRAGLAGRKGALGILGGILLVTAYLFTKDTARAGGNSGLKMSA